MNIYFPIYLLFTLITCSGYLPAQPVNEPISRINSPYDERAPVMSRDGAVLYFTIAHHPKNLGGKQDEGDIWVATWDGKAWSTPVHGGSIINNTGYNAVGALSKNGRTLYLFGNYNLSGHAKNMCIAISKKTFFSNWSAPKPIAIPYLTDRLTTLSGYVLPNKHTLIFAGTLYDTYGAEDIYICRKKLSGKWSEPQNMGAIINTPYQEFSPWLSEDTKSLYFASNGHSGYGSFDIYRSTRLDSGWSNWSTPVNIGDQVNSEGRELFYRKYPQKGTAFYTSTLNSEGYGDIRTILSPIRNAQRPPEDSLNRAKNADNGNAWTPVASELEIHGHIVERHSESPIIAMVYFYDEVTAETSSTSDGTFIIKLPARDTYHVKIVASGYMSQVTTIRPPLSEKWVAHFTLNPIRVGSTIQLENVLFERGTATLLEVSFGPLNRVVTLLENNPGMEIELAGHTDNQGSYKQNIKLSQERVDAVKKYLVGMGISESRISGKGYGGTKPIADNRIESTRQLNRRVEFTIIKN